eukprot:Blabericola_migrator_1__13166@NODE_901_length_6140_cov_65_133707_g631_i0_p6_GENE_NODE_901_length_6140_cov_65_133707_g631_i0NODE_901_length_6140_cov_65_133707_g631_i0_p6_ORF_typecomplete_len125_score12_20TatC/PF00902_18/0_0097DUF21/PF01595_20/0_04DUF2456/PF10445_9/39DUF2456/PF10445_9/12_NODE_901_length_6140_cov_65_133707_g631_i015531927
MDIKPELIPIRSISADLSGNEAFLGNLIRLQKLYAGTHKSRCIYAYIVGSFLALAAGVALWSLSAAALCNLVESEDDDAVCALITKSKTIGWVLSTFALCFLVFQVAVATCWAVIVGIRMMILS